MSDIFVKYRGPFCPKYQTDGSSGCDLHANEDCVIEPGCRKVVSTGLYLEMPPGLEGQIRSRSGIAAKKGVFVLNSPGTVDCFAMDSKILTVDGYKSFHDLKIGDCVFSLNEKSFELERDQIVAKVDVSMQDVISLVLDDGTILKVTLNTLVLTNNGFIKASELKLTDEIIVVDDNYNP